MEKIDRAAAKKISEALESAAQAVADDLGLSVKVGGGRFDPEVGTFSPKVEFSLADAERREFELNAPLLGLKQSAYGTMIPHRGGEVKLVGINLRAQRFPILVEDGEGKRWKLTEQAVQHLVVPERPSEKAMRLAEKAK